MDLIKAGVIPYTFLRMLIGGGISVVTPINTDNAPNHCQKGREGGMPMCSITVAAGKSDHGDSVQQESVTGYVRIFCVWGGRQHHSPQQYNEECGKRTTDANGAATTTLLLLLVPLLSTTTTTTEHYN